MTTSRVCANCGSTMVAAFCAACGQSQDDPRKSLWSWAREFAAEQFSVTARLPRSIWLLISQPGYLTREWIAGRRARYLSPVQLYMIALLVMLIVISIVGLPTGLDNQFDYSVFDLDQQVSILQDAIVSRWRIAILCASLAFLPVMVMSVAVLAPARDAVLADHVVFSIHTLAFFLFLLSVTWVIIDIDLPLTLLPSAFWSIAYLAFATRRVYVMAGLSGFLRVALVCVLFVFATLTSFVVSVAVAGDRALDVTEDLDWMYTDLRRARLADELFFRAMNAHYRGDTVDMRQLLPVAIKAQVNVSYRYRDAERDFQHAWLRHLAGDDRAAAELIAGARGGEGYMLLHAIGARVALNTQDSAAARTYAGRFLSMYASPGHDTTQYRRYRRYMDQMHAELAHLSNVSVGKQELQ